MYTVFVVLLIIASILLTLVVLVQNSKGGGLAANFAAGNQTFGVRQTVDFLEKATWTLAIAILVFCLAATMFPGKNIENIKKSSTIELLSREQLQDSDLSNIRPASSGTETPTPVAPGTATPLQ